MPVDDIHINSGYDARGALRHTPATAAIEGVMSGFERGGRLVDTFVDRELRLEDEARRVRQERRMVEDRDAAAMAALLGSAAGPGGQSGSSPTGSGSTGSGGGGTPVQGISDPVAAQALSLRSVTDEITGAGRGQAEELDDLQYFIDSLEAGTLDEQELLQLEKIAPGIAGELTAGQDVDGLAPSLSPQAGDRAQVALEALMAEKQLGREEVISNPMEELGHDRNFMPHPSQLPTYMNTAAEFENMSPEAKQAFVERYAAFYDSITGEQSGRVAEAQLAEQEDAIGRQEVALLDAFKTAGKEPPSDEHLREMAKAIVLGEGEVVAATMKANFGFKDSQIRNIPALAQLAESQDRRAAVERGEFAKRTKDQDDAFAKESGAIEDARSEILKVPDQIADLSDQREKLYAQQDQELDPATKATIQFEIDELTKQAGVLAARDTKAELSALEEKDIELASRDARTREAIPAQAAAEGADPGRSARNTRAGAGGRRGADPAATKRRLDQADRRLALAEKASERGDYKLTQADRRLSQGDRRLGLAETAGGRSERKTVVAEQGGQRQRFAEMRTMEAQAIRNGITTGQIIDHSQALGDWSAARADLAEAMLFYDEGDPQLAMAYEVEGAAQARALSASDPAVLRDVTRYMTDAGRSRYETLSKMDDTMVVIWTDEDEVGLEPGTEVIHGPTGKRAVIEAE